MTYKNMHGDKIAERIAAQKEAMRQARKEIAVSYTHLDVYKRQDLQ